MRRWIPTLGATALACGVMVSAPIASNAASLDVTSTVDSIDAGSLRAAIIEANGADGADTIALEAGSTYSLNVTGAGEDAGATGDLDVTGEVTIEGNGATIDASALDDRAFHVLAEGNVTLVDVTITGGTASDEPSGEGGGSGGAVLNAGSLSAEGVTMSGNSAKRAGGAVEGSEGSMTTLTDSELSGNSAGEAPGNGGGLHITGAGDATITDTTVGGNRAALEGGGLWNGSGTMTISGGEISDNFASGAEADDGGGGVFNNGGTLEITGASVTGNFADGAAGSGGGILNLGGTMSLSDTKVDGNDSVRAGGGIEATDGSKSTIDGGTIWQNSTGGSPGNGGGLHLTGEGTVDIDGTVIADNRAEAEGGGLWNSVGGTMIVTNATISSNKAWGPEADQGGGGLYNDGGEVGIDGSTISENTADGEAGSGGGLLNNGGLLEITGSDILDNTSQRAGGGIEATVDGSDTRLSRVLLANNSTGAAPGNGGGLHLTGAGEVLVEFSMVSGNSAAKQGGGLWNSGAGTMSLDSTTLSENTTDGEGGGLYNDGGSMDVLNSTVSANTAKNGGGVFSDSGDVMLLHTTVTLNSDGLMGAVEIRNSIIAANEGDDGTDEVSSIGGNVVGSSIMANSGDEGDVSDPKLGALAANGGPTMTHSPKSGSPAIDAGLDELMVDVDQRGADRPMGDAADSGSVEAGEFKDDGDRAGNGGEGGMTPAAPAAPVEAEPTFTG